MLATTGGAYDPDADAVVHDELAADAAAAEREAGRADWVAAERPWKLTADHAEVKALRALASGCKSATVTFTPAP